jgi:type I restriction enzyme M protein
MAEMNIVNKSQVVRSSRTSRIEGEFYLREYNVNKSTLLSHPHRFLRSLLVQPVKTGHTPSMKNKTYYGNDVAFVKTDNLHDNVIKDDFKDYLSAKGNAVIAGTELQEGDILITIIGATFDVVPRSSIVKKDILPANINQNIALIKVDGTKSYPGYISTYLNTRHGKTYLRYLSRQTGQVNLNCREVEEVIVPIFSKQFQLTIADIVKSAHECQDEAKRLYSEAEIFLLSELGLDNFTPTQSLFSVKGLADSFHMSGRIDGEYYQMKFENMLQHISKHETRKLWALVDISKSIEPGSKYYGNEGIPFVRVSDITKFGIEQPEIKIPLEIAPPSLYPRKDTILLTKDGTVGIAYKVEENIDCVTSGALLHLKVKSHLQKYVMPDYLTLVLNSIVVQLQAERDAGGSVIQHWKPSEIGAVVVPILKEQVQQMVSDDVQMSFAMRRKSEQLLERAKEAMELAIEEGEVVAMKWLEGVNNDQCCNS